MDGTSCEGWVSAGDGSRGSGWPGRASSPALAWSTQAAYRHMANTPQRKNAPKTISSISSIRNRKVVPRPPAATMRKPANSRAGV